LELIQSVLRGSFQDSQDVKKLPERDKFNLEEFDQICQITYNYTNEVLSRAQIEDSPEVCRRFKS